MKPNNKPLTTQEWREFRINEVTGGASTAEESIPNGYHTHVIEHEAYETVVSSNKLQRMTINSLRGQLDEKQAKIEKLEAALKLSIYRACVQCSADRIAYEALGDENGK